MDCGTGRRAVALFEGQGLSVIPSPTGHTVNLSKRRKYLVSYLPGAGNIVYVETVVREVLGLWWAYFRGWGSYNS